MTIALKRRPDPIPVSDLALMSRLDLAPPNEVSKNPETNAEIRYKIMSGIDEYNNSRHRWNEKK